MVLVTTLVTIDDGSVLSKLRLDQALKGAPVILLVEPGHGLSTNRTLTCKMYQSCFLRVMPYFIVSQSYTRSPKISTFGAKRFSER
eukprot:SAG11_NODE_21876_length_416_cov_6.255521_1_plen_86_part_00